MACSSSASPNSSEHVLKGIRNSDSLHSRNGCADKKSSCSSSNGHVPRSGTLHSNDGLGAIVTPRSGFSLEKDELVRLLTQALRDLGYARSADSLERESGVAGEDPDVAVLRDAVLEGSWDVALSILRQRVPHAGVHENGVSPAALDSAAYGDTKVPVQARDGCLDRCLFVVLQRKFMELVESQKIPAAITCLRDEVALVAPRSALGKLAQRLLADGNTRNENANNGVQENNLKVWCELQLLLPESFVLPQSRLLALLDDALLEQIRRNCLSKDAICETAVSLVRDLPRLRRSEQMDFECVQRTVNSRAQLWCLSCSPNGEFVAVGASDSHVGVYRVDLLEGSVRLSRTQVSECHSKGITCLSWSPDGQCLASADADGLLVLQEMVEKSLKTRTEPIRAHVGRVTSLCWTKDSRYVFSAGFDYCLRMHSISGSLAASWSGVSIYDMCLAGPKNFLIASTSEQLRVLRYKPANSGERTDGDRVQQDRFRIFESRKLSIQGACEKQPKMRFSSMMLSHDGRRLFTNVVDGSIIEWDLKRSRQLRRFDGIYQASCVLRAALGGHKESLLACGSAAGAIHLWERDALPHSKGAGGPPVAATCPCNTLKGHTQPVNAVAWHPVFENVLFSASDDGTMRVWSIRGP